MPPPCILLLNTQIDAGVTSWVKTGTVNSTTTDVYLGTHAANLSGFSSTMTQTRPGAVAGRIYTLSVYAKREGSTSAAQVGLRFRNGGTLLNETIVNITATAYTLYSVSGTAPTGTTHVEVFALKLGGTAVKADEFCLEETIPAIGQCILVTNSGFESGGNNWLVSGGSGSVIADPYSGVNAVQVTGSGARVYQRVSVTSGGTYELTGYAKITNNPSYAELFIQWRDINGSALTSIIQPVLNNVTSYKSYSLKGIAPGNAVYADVGGYKTGGSSNTLIFDQVCFSLTNALGGGSFPLTCGCSDNLLPNSSFDEHYVGAFPNSMSGKPVAPIANGNSTALPPWSTVTSSANSFLVNDNPNTVNNPEGQHFIWLPGNGDTWYANTNFSTNLNLEHGQSYTLCFYAAAWAATLNGSGLPNGGAVTQISSVVNLGITFQSGYQIVESWSVPQSATFLNLSWRKFTYTFTYDIANPVSNFALRSARNSVGTAVDAISLSKTTCLPTVSCPAGGITYERWGGINGTDVRDLLSNANYPNNYNETGALSNFQGPSNYSDNYGTKAYGYLIAPTTGNYTFTVTSSDQSRVYLSPDLNFMNKALIASVPGFTNVAEYNKYASQTSAAIALTAGQKYYVELIHKAGAVNSDHFQLYWQTPSNAVRTIIPGIALQPICYAEVCGNGKDDDFDGLADCLDPECSGSFSAGYVVTDETCGNAGGEIDLSPSGTDVPFSFVWADMSPEARWTFNGNTDDLSGNLHHANGTTGSIIYSSTAVEGSGSLYLNGSSYIRYSVDNGFMEVPVPAMTVSMWVEPDVLNQQMTLFDEGGSTGGRGFSIFLNNNVLQAGVRNGGALTTDVTHTFPGDGLWHHVAAVFDNGDLTVYLDGVASPTITAPFATIGNHGNNGGIGAAIGGSVITSGITRYRGFLDDVRYHLAALAPCQIADLARNDGDRTCLTAGNYAVQIFTGSGCSVSQSMMVNSASNHTDGGTISGDETSCGGSFDPGMISTLTPPGSAPGVTEYSWESSTDSIGWTVIGGATSATYDPPSIAAVTWYRRGGRVVPCTGWVYSNAVKKSFSSNFTDAGAIAGLENNCGAFNPGVISSTGAPSGGAGSSAEYQWESSTDSLAWTTIGGATASSYDPGAIAQTTWFRRGARRMSCAAYLYA